MKAKLRFLIGQSLKKKLNTKWFKIANILIFILIIGVLNMDRLISFFGGDFEDVTKVYVLEPLETLKDKLEDEESIIINIKSSQDNYIEAETFSFEPISMITEQIIQNSLNNVKSSFVLQNSNMTEEEIASLTSNVSIKKTVTNPELDENAEGKDILSSGLIIIFIIPFFILITMLTQMIGAEINDEKSTRGMEIIISNVSPKIHFLSKIISSTLFVLVQAGLLLLDIMVGFLVRKLLGTSLVSSDVTGVIGDTLKMVKDTGVLDLLLKGLPIIIILFLLSFLAYAIVAGVLASMTTNIEDYQQLQTPLMIILMVGYYIAIMASAFEGSVFVKIVAYIPMISFLVAPVIYLLGQITLGELILSTIICGIVVYIFFYYGLRIYKVGILNYSSQNLWKKIFKSVKEK